MDVVSRLSGRVNAVTCRRLVGVGSALYLAAVFTVLLPDPAAAQSTSLATSGIVPGALSCAASNNGTGHIECAEYLTGGGWAAVSWEAPPGPNSNPAGAEAVGTVDHLPLPTPAGSLQGFPGCTTAADGGGTIICLVKVGTGSQILLQAMSFSLTQPNPVSSGFTTVTSASASAGFSNPACTNGGNAGTVAQNNGPQALCAVVINNELFAVDYSLAAPTKPTLVAMASLGSSFTGSPGCTTVDVTTGTADFVAVCAIRSGGGLLAFAFDAKGALGSKLLPAASFTGDPSCTTPADNALTAICAIAGSDALRGIAIPYVQGAALSPGAYQMLGTPPDTGAWGGMVGCAPPNDTQNAGNLVTCAALSSSAAVFGVTFDPRVGTTYGPTGPLFTAASGVNGTPSCIMLNVDPDQITCGATTADSGSVSFNLPVGLTPPAVQQAILSVLEN
jgi:hypothetical protein